MSAADRDNDHDEHIERDISSVAISPLIRRTSNVDVPSLKCATPLIRRRYTPLVDAVFALSLVVYRKTNCKAFNLELRVAQIHCKG